MSTTPAATEKGRSQVLATEQVVKPALARAKVKIDRLHTSYANVVTTNANRDEVALAFGLKTPGDPAHDVEVCLHTRIVMSPFAAKRLLERLKRMQETVVPRTVVTT